MWEVPSLDALAPFLTTLLEGSLVHQRKSRLVLLMYRFCLNPRIKGFSLPIVFLKNDNKTQLRRIRVALDRESPSMENEEQSAKRFHVAKPANTTKYIPNNIQYQIAVASNSLANRVKGNEQTFKRIKSSPIGSNTATLIYTNSVPHSCYQLDDWICMPTFSELPNEKDLILGKQWIP